MPHRQQDYKYQKDKLALRDLDNSINDYIKYFQSNMHNTPLNHETGNGDFMGGSML